MFSSMGLVKTFICLFTLFVIIVAIDAQSSPALNRYPAHSYPITLKPTS